MTEGQAEIYYLCGESRSLIENAPHLEKFKEKGYEVLFLPDPMDELMMQSITEFEGKKLASVGKGSVDLGTRRSGRRRRRSARRSRRLRGALQSHAEAAGEARQRDPPLLAADELSGLPCRRWRLQSPLGTPLWWQAGPVLPRIMELNPSHPLLAQLKGYFDKNKEDPRVGDFAELLFGQALLVEGRSFPTGEVQPPGRRADDTGEQLMLRPVRRRPEMVVGDDRGRLSSHRRLHRAGAARDDPRYQARSAG